MTSPLESAADVLAVADRAYRQHPELRDQIAGLRTRLDEPLRIALVGSVKAGKSTLLNALLGERVAPTDARECTRVVTWYRRGASPNVRVYTTDQHSRVVPPRRHDDRLELDLGDQDADSIERLEIAWPASLLDNLTLIDTPGTISSTDGVSTRTDAFLLPPDGAAGADAVVYLLRSLHTSDVQFLRNLRERTRHGVSAVGAIAVLSRVDELGGGGLASMVSVNKAVHRLQRDPALAGVCETVVPVAGLLGLGAATLRQGEFTALLALSKVDRQRLRRLMTSAELFMSAEGADLPHERMRAALVERLGVYGIRLALAVIRGGVDDAPSLAAELSRRSGIDELRRYIDVHFVQRRVELKAHSVVLAALRLARAHPTPGRDEVISRAEEHLADAHSFQELQLLGRVVAGRVLLEPAQLRELERVLGGEGTSYLDRLNARDTHLSDVELQALAVEQLRRWRTLAANPLLDPSTLDACRAAARSCEHIVDDVVRQSVVATG